MTAGTILKSGRAGRAGRILVPVCLGLLFLGAARRPSPPLVMENADHLEGVRSTGEYVLSGNVRFRHGELRLETQRALWERVRNRVTCETAMRITHHGSLLTADRGMYDREADRAQAEGHVVMRDSSGEVNATGDRLDYDRVLRVAVLSGNPVARRFYPVRLVYPGGDSTRIPEEKPADTLTIRALKLRYNDSTGVSEAEGNVVITRRDLRITCGRAQYRQKQDSLILQESPVARVEDSEIKGRVIRMGMAGEELRGLRVRGEAEALSFEKATDSTPARNSKVTGDSLFAVFRDGGLDSVEVFTKAEGTYWEVNRPDYINRMNGDYMVMRFHDREAREAEVLGSARSTYYHFESDTLKGRNRAQGDVIRLAFSDGKIAEVLVRGTASGVYEGTGLAAGKASGKPSGKPRRPAADTTKPAARAADQKKGQP